MRRLTFGAGMQTMRFKHTLLKLSLSDDVYGGDMNIWSEFLWRWDSGHHELMANMRKNDGY